MTKASRTVKWNGQNGEVEFTVTDTRGYEEKTDVFFADGDKSELKKMVPIEESESVMRCSGKEFTNIRIDDFLSRKEGVMVVTCDYNGNNINVTISDADAAEKIRLAIAEASDEAGKDNDYQKYIARCEKRAKAENEYQESYDRIQSAME